VLVLAGRLIGDFLEVIRKKAGKDDLEAVSLERKNSIIREVLTIDGDLTLSFESLIED
jgi:hypothetical protein